MLQKNWSELIKPNKMEVNLEETNGKIGVLTAEPLERGFGLTLGNAIRRILLYKEARNFYAIINNCFINFLISI